MSLANEQIATTENGTPICSICGQPFNGSNYSQDEHFALCYMCSHEQFVKSYHHYKGLSPKFHGRNTKKFFGLEIEMYPEREYRDSMEGIQVARGRVAYAFAKEGRNGRAMLESDSSIQVHGGFELILQPMTLKYINNSGIFRRFAELPVHSFRHYSTGLHVHVSRNAISPDALANTLLFMMSPENENFIRHLGQRTPNTFCKKNRKQFYETWKEYATRRWSGHNNRYFFVNLTNVNTIEFRFFKGNVNPEALLRAVQFVDSITEFAETHEASEMNFENYISWLFVQNKSRGKHQNQWSNLTKWLRRRWENTPVINTPSHSMSYIPPEEW